MGNVSGKLEDAPTLYLKDQSRLSIASLVITNARNRTVLKIVPNSYPCTKIQAKKDLGDDGLVEFVQDPDPQSQTPLLLKLCNEDELFFNFKFNIRQRGESFNGTLTETNVSGLTFAIASNGRDLENLVTREFHADPNLHKNPNVNLLGDYATEGSNAIEFEWKWRWRPPQGAEERKSMGWRNTCSFLEYDQRAHKLSTLAQFSFWVQSTPRIWPPSPLPGSEFTVGFPPRLRTVSSNSPEFKANDNSPDAEPPSPLIDTFDGSTLGPSSTNAPSVKVDNCPRPVDSAMAEDGPLFRATIKSLEQKTGTLRTKMKKVLKRAEQARQAQNFCNDAVSAFMEALRDAASSGNAVGIQPALDHYFERTYREILLFERQNEASLQKLIIDPLTRLYNLDIKQAESKKKDFEEESRDYYNYVSRYLGIRNDSAKEKKKIESETKYQSKRKNFELKRFDYCTFMQDLHGGRKEQEVLSQLTKFADAQAKSYLATAKRVQELMPQLEALTYEVKESEKEFQVQRTEREERRRVLEKSSKNYLEPDNIPTFIAPTVITNPTTFGPTASDILGHNRGFEKLGVGTSSIRAVSSGSETGPEGNMSPPPPSHGLSANSATSLLNSSPSTSNSKFKGIRDLQEKEYNGLGVTNGESERRKEGLLWALSRPGSHADPKGLNKQAWHKYWVVLAGGQLYEYSNWKQKLDLHNDPINLKMASVREARNSDRRFCFEVVTPQYKRVYQATSEEDMNTWIGAVNNAVKSTIEGSGSVRNFDTSHVENNDGPTDKLKNIQTALTGKAPHYHHSVHGTNPTSYGSSSNNNVYRRTTVGARPINPRRNSSNFGEDPEKLLQMVREADSCNSSCADCGSQIKTEWVSINLGIVLCIECSGLHRSLGTHISKVRSLTLDVTSFTPDLIELLCQVGNKLSNSIWEAKLDPSQRPDPRSSRETRLRFITSKYVDRAYVQPLSPTLSQFASPDECILDAVKRNDLPGCLYALALHGSPNTTDPATSIHAIFLALAAADPPSAGANELSPSSSNPALSPMTFPLAELLMQNGGEVPFPLPAAGLSLAAKNYLAAKTAKRAPVGPSASTSAGSGLTVEKHEGYMTSSGAISSMRERQQKEKERLQKRVSTGARLHRAPQLDR